MERLREANTSRRLFYGWWIVIAGFLLVLAGLAASTYGTGQLFERSVVDFGGTRGQAATLFSALRSVGVVATIVFGLFIDRFGPRLISAVVVSIVALGFFVAGSSSNFVAIAIAGGLVGIGTGNGAPFVLSVQTAAANWFARRRTAALAVVALGVLVGSELGDLYDEQLISGPGQFILLGAALMVIGIPLVLVMRHRPEEYGAMPDGRNPAVEEPDTEKANFDFGPIEAMRTKAFWLLTLALVFMNSNGLFGVLGLPFLADRGMEFQSISETFRIMSFSGVLGIVVFGMIGDRFRKHYLMALAAALQSLSWFVLLLVDTVNEFFFFALVFGFGGGIVPLLVAARADYFGRKNFATISVLMLTASWVLGVPLFAGLPLLAGSLMTDGNYLLLLSVFALLGLAGAILFVFARPPANTTPSSQSASTDEAD